MRIAVIGTGISGMAAAWLLSRRHEVVVYERNDRPGGHSNTVDMPPPSGVDGAPTPVDTGFIVFNHVTYPNLVKLFETLGVRTETSDMSFAFSVDGGRLEYCGDSLRSLFAQVGNLVRPSHYGMIRDILRFYREAPALLKQVDEGEPSLADYLAANRYGHAFVYRHLLPMGAAIWSTTIGEMMNFPARSFVRFFHNHGLLKVKERPVWQTVSGGSREYVARLTAPYAHNIRRGCAVAGIRRLPHAAIVRDAQGHEDRFDAVVLATHADQALALLEDPSPAERRTLGAFQYQKNRAVLHRDAGLMPKRRRAWASWNYLASSDPADRHRVSVTYWMNRLQNLDPADPIFVSLNPLAEPAPGKATAAFDYDHPQFDAAALDAQTRLPAIQGRQRTWFCGSYCGYGFHEDGLASGLAVAESLGGMKRPWIIAEASPAGFHARPIAPEITAAAAE
ncbi:MAG: FAD-dependent oxidoreductase [Alphaproteobacteria bacterium]|jgi:predicted NAD/FAD-binding protein|nr:FAD-dependent oxidoreductase [Alphaproteobacteria bacterium]